MTSAWQKLNEYFQRHADAKLTHDPSDVNVIEDPLNSANIMAINLLIRAGTSEQKLQKTAKAIQKILDDNKIAGVAVVVTGSADCTGIKIMAEQTLPKSLGIRSEFDGVPVGFTLVHSLDVFRPKSNAGGPKR